jgi:prophage antirepressor-like protein
MTTELQTFAFHSHPFTVITDEHGASWFVAKEVSDILEYSDAEAMTRKLDEDEVQNLQIVGFGNRGVNVINESGLWSSVLRSTKPEAKAVKKWLTSEVLPAIHKTGGYGLANPAQQLAQLQIKHTALLEKHLEMLTQENDRLTMLGQTTTVRRWTADEDKTLLEMKANGSTNTEIGLVLRRGRDAIRYRYTILSARQGGSQ